MNQKSTHRFKQRLQAYALLTVMVALSSMVQTSFAQTASCACTTSSANLLTNGSFEINSSGWSVSGGSLTFGSKYAVCGSKNAYLTFKCNTAKIWKQVTSITAGKTVTFKAWAGTHTPGIKCGPRLTLSFYNSSNTLLKSSYVVVDKDVDKPDYKLKEYTITAVAPAGTYYTKVEGSIGCNILKLDALCLTATNDVTLGSIGDKVWSDANCNGLQDAGEQGICKIPVQLKNATGTVVASTVTSTSGNYIFNGLAAGNYTVVFPATIIGGGLVTKNVGSNRDIDSDPVQSTGAATVALAAGQNITNIDAGYCANTMALGNRVWFDSDNNGIDNNEVGISAAQVKLYKDDNNDNIADGAALSTITTDANGYYLFKGLQPGNYIVGVIIPAGYTSSTINGGDPDNNINLDDNGQVLVGNEIRGLAITLTAGNEPDGSCRTANTNITYDFGFYKPIVTTTNCDCTSGADNLLTNASFENGSTGWSVTGGTITTGTGYVICGSKNAFLNRTTGTAKAWQDVTSIIPGSTVTFRGWSGTHTPGMTCSPKLALSFYNSAYVLLSSAAVTVDKDVDKPDYKLKEYTITAIAPAGTYYTRVEGSIGCNVLKLDALCLTAVPPLTGCLGDKVWTDLNANGIQDSNEPGIPGVTVTLANSANITTNVVTDNNGGYKFCGLAAGSYTITFGNPGSQYVPTNPNTGTDDAIDSDPVGGIVSSINLEPGETNLSIDAGFILKNLNLGNFVWFDKNANGIQDAGETGVGNVTVNLYNDDDSDNVPDGAAISTTVTNTNGVYGFASLMAGKYIVGVVLPAGYDATITTATSATPDNDDNTDNNAVLSTSGEVFSNFVTLTNSGEPTTDGDGNNGNLTIDVGLTGNASLGDFVWNDLNANGVQDDNEPGIQGVTVTLTFPNGSTANTVTDANGLYLFSNLLPGTYAVTFSTPSGFLPTVANSPGDDAKDSDPVAGVVTGIAIADGDQNLTIDAGFYKGNMNIGNYVWYDQNTNGVQDAEEKGVSGATVNLYADANGDNVADGAAIASVVTDNNGKYGFGSLAPGKYIAGVVIPAGYAAAATTNTSAAPDNDDNTDNNGVSASGGVLFSNTITLISNNEPVTDGDDNNGNLTLDFGLTGVGSIGDYVWHDLDSNGIQTPLIQNPGMNGVTVTLTYPNGATLGTSTDASGKYLFTNLAPGNYTVTFTTPAHFNPTRANAGSDDAIDSDPVNGVVSVALGAGENNTSIDAGFYCHTLYLGDYVWNDQNNNGIQDAGEKGISGVTVNLYMDLNGDNTADGPSLLTATTDANGLYKFNELAPGRYIAGVVIPAGYKPSATTTTSATPDNDDNTDNNGVTVESGELRSNPITLISWWEPSNDGDDIRSNLTLDFGLTGTGSIGDYVWHDLDSNGIQSPLAQNPGMKGVAVILTYPTGVSVNTLTDGAGKYLFSNLAPGNYAVTFTTPTHFNPTRANAGSDDSIDSDPVDGVVNVTLGAGENNNTIDAGYYCHTLYLGNNVWNDVNNNGIQDAGEKGISGVTVNLYMDINFDNIADGPALMTTMTDADGLYKFNELAPGRYIVGVMIPAGFKAGATTATSATPDNDDNTDNNGVNVNGAEVRSNAITLISWWEPGNDGDDIRSNATLDFGFNCPTGTAARANNAAVSNSAVVNTVYNGFDIQSVYPNPFTDRLNISYTSDKAQKVTIRIFDNGGKTIYNAQVMIQGGKNNILVSNLGNHASGSYTVELKTSNAVYTKKLMK